MTTTTADDGSELLDLRAIGRTIRRFALPIAIASVIALALTAAVYWRASPSYVATAELQLDRVSDPVVPPTADDKQQVFPTDSPSVDTAVQVLESPDLLGRVVDSQHLLRNPLFNPPSTNGGAPLPPNAARDRATRILAGGLTVQREGVSYAIAIHYASPDPVLAAAIANAVMREYLEGQRSAQEADTQRTAQLLGNRMAQLRDQVLTAEGAVARYRAQHGLFAASDVSSITQQELSVLDTQLAEAKSAQAAANARLSAAQSQLASGKTGDTLGESLNSPTVSALRQQRAQLGAQLSDLESRYGPRHPDLIKIKDQIADLDAQINAEVSRIVSNVGTDARVANQRAASISGSISALEGRLAADNNASVRLDELQRNADSARALYQTFLDNYKQAVARQGTEASGAHAIAAAQVPALPTTPNPLIFLAIGLVAAVASSTAVVTVMTFLERGFRTGDAVEKRLGIASLGAIPALESLREPSSVDARTWPPQYVVEHPKSAFSEAFRSLRTAILLAPTDRETRVVALTSALPGEGKTSAAICLARTSAMAGTSTVLIDCDTRRRESSRLLADAIPRGLAEVLAGECTLQDALVRDTPSGAWILAQRPGVEIPLDALGSERMVRVLEELRQRFEFVILDTAPILPVAEARVVAKLADAVLLLVRWKSTPIKAAELALRKLRAIDARVAGVALSRVNLVEQAKSGFGDPELYFNSYRQYYA